jgi:hypothetical protein
MNLIFAFTHHTGIRLAEIAFLLILAAGVWLAVARLGRTVGAGVLLAIAGLLLIIASHWGRFG